MLAESKACKFSLVPPRTFKAKNKSASKQRGHLIRYFPAGAVFQVSSANDRRFVCASEHSVSGDQTLIYLPKLLLVPPVCYPSWSTMAVPFKGATHARAHAHEA